MKNKHFFNIQMYSATLPPCSLYNNKRFNNKRFKQYIGFVYYVCTHTFSPTKANFFQIKVEQTGSITDSAAFSRHDAQCRGRVCGTFVKTRVTHEPVWTFVIGLDILELKEHICHQPGLRWTSSSCIKSPPPDHAGLRFRSRSNHRT